MGTLQRFPKVIGNDSAARELALTARKFFAEEAKQIGFVRYGKYLNFHLLATRQKCLIQKVPITATEDNEHCISLYFS